MYITLRLLHVNIYNFASFVEYNAINNTFT